MVSINTNGKLHCSYLLTCQRYPFQKLDSYGYICLCFGDLLLHSERYPRQTLRAITIKCQYYYIVTNAKPVLVRDATWSPGYKCRPWLKSAANETHVHSFIEPRLFLVRVVAGPICDGRCRWPPKRWQPKSTHIFLVSFGVFLWLLGGVFGVFFIRVVAGLILWRALQMPTWALTTWIHSRVSQRQLAD